MIALPSLSEQRWTGVHRVLADLESAVARAPEIRRKQRREARRGRSMQRCSDLGRVTDVEWVFGSGDF